MKTPDEIKKGLDCCRGINAPCEGCPYNMETLDYDESVSKLHDDALAYIQQLEREKKNLKEMLRNAKRNIERIERDLDAVISEIGRDCETCKHCEKFRQKGMERRVQREQPRKSRKKLIFLKS